MDSHMLSVDDEEIRREVWKGLIPVVFTLTSNEITTLEPPEPYYILAPRMSYLPSVTSSVQNHFLLASPPIKNEIWFEYKGKPLKWQYPIGVLFDLLSNEGELPWSLSVHFQGFPVETILRCPNQETVKGLFVNVLKEANFIRYGDAAKVNSLSVSDSSSIWEGIVHHDFLKFWQANTKLLPSELSSIKHVPIRLFQHGSFASIQDLIQPADEQGIPRTLGSVLTQLLPSLFPTTEPSTTNVIIQGISPSLDTPITWLSENCSHPDNFLYIIVSPLVIESSNRTT